jgi:hypothetical protein
VTALNAEVCDQFFEKQGSARRNVGGNIRLPLAARGFVSRFVGGLTHQGGIWVRGRRCRHCCPPLISKWLVSQPVKAEAGGDLLDTLGGDGGEQALMALSIYK